MRFGLSVALVVAAADRLSKWWLIDIYDLPARGRLALTPFFNLVMAWNPGVSFSLLDDFGEAGRWGLSLVAGAFVVVLVVWLARARDTAAGFALGLVIGGAIGNIYDRVMFGAVADFFDLHIGGWHWPAFNIADSAIAVGVVLLLWDALVRPRAVKRKE